MWIRVDETKIPLMKRCRQVTVVEGTREPEMGEGVSFWDKPHTAETWYEMWVDDKHEDKIPRVAYAEGHRDGVAAVKKALDSFVPDLPDNFKD